MKGNWILGNQESALISVHLRLMKLKKQNQNRPLAGNPKYEALNPKQVERIHLKKQSQFSGEQISVKSYMKGYYE